MALAKIVNNQTSIPCNFSANGRSKIIYIITSVAVSAIALHMLTSIPQADALEPNRMLPSLLAFGVGIWKGIAGFRQVYNLYDAKDDGRLLEQIQLKDCGSLSKMAPVTEGCYRQYLSNSIDRIPFSEYRQKFDNLFDRCFEDRLIYDCTWSGWWNSDLIYKAPNLALNI